MLPPIVLGVVAGRTIQHVTDQEPAKIIPAISDDTSAVGGATNSYRFESAAPQVVSPDSTPGHQGHSHADEVRDLHDISAIEVISRAAVLLMSAAAEQLGLSDPDPENPEHRDLDEARQLITALAGLVNAAAPDLGPHAAAFRDGLSGLQGAFREYSLFPDAPGQGPGESGARGSHHH